MHKFIRRLFFMRITVVAKGDLETYIQQDMDRTGLSAGMTCHNLARLGMKYQEGLQSMVTFATAIQGQRSFSGYGECVPPIL